jgi:hypothetical protein
MKYPISNTEYPISKWNALWGNSIEGEAGIPYLDIGYSVLDIGYSKTLEL